MKDKKAITTFEMLMWIPRIIFLVIIMFAVMFIVRSYVTTTIDVSELKANVFANRVLYSPTGMAYLDPDTNRAYPGVVDIEKFKLQITEKFLEKAVYYGEKNQELGARFLLKNLDENEETEVFYNEDFFKEQKKIADSGPVFTEGPGGVRAYTKNYDVLILKNKVLHKGILTIEVVVPNS